MTTRVAPDVWDLVETACLCVLIEDGMATSHNVAAYADEHDCPEVTQNRALIMLMDLYARRVVTRRIVHGPTQYLFEFVKHGEEGQDLQERIDQ